MNLRLSLLVDFYVGGALHILLKPFTVLLGKILRRNHDLSVCSSVTFIKMLGGGSLVIAYPALVALKQLKHIRSLRLVTTPSIKPFAEILGVFDEILVIRDTSLLLCAFDSLVVICKLLGTEVIVDFEIHSRLTTVFSLLTCARNRVGFYTNISFWKKHLSTHLLFCNVSTGVYHCYDQTAHLFGGVVPSFETCTSVFRCTMGLLARREELPCFRIGLAPYCSVLSKERMLGNSDWALILKRVLQSRNSSRQIEIHLLGGKSDIPAACQLSEILRQEFSGVTVINHAGVLPLRDSVRKLAEFDQVLCVDSALLHFSRLVGTATVSFWGPTDPQVLLRPSDGNRDEIHYEKLSCSPCVHMAQRAPCKGKNLCMDFAVNPSREGDRNPMWLET